MIPQIPHLPEEKRPLLEQLVDALSHVPGVAAIVLGGSYASGTHHAGSDMDIGLFYAENQPFAIAEIQRVAESIALDGTAAATDFYGWGPWVNGGAWIHTPHGKVDFIYRNIEQVQRTISDALQGISQHDYAQQPAYGFYSVIYLAELEICIPLYDPENLISGFKQQIAAYPARLKETIISDSLWAAEFSLIHARGFATRGDIYNTAGCLTRVAANITQALFAINERYFLRDKQVFEVLASFEHLPANYLAQINQILAAPGSTAQELSESVTALERAWRSVVDLPAVGYAPKFQI